VVVTADAMQTTRSLFNQLCERVQMIPV